MFHVCICLDVFLHTCPIDPRNANGRDKHTDALYDRSDRNAAFCHTGVLGIHDARGNPDVFCSHDDPAPRNVCDLLASFRQGVFDIPCAVVSDFAILSVCLFLCTHYQQMPVWL